MQPNDIISVRYIKGFTPIQTVSVVGEVLYPGVYSIQSKDERISDLLERVGGFTPFAYKEGVTLVRKKTDEGELQQEDFLSELVALENGSDSNKSLKKAATKTSEYIDRAGGFSNRAKKSSIYVLYANGDVKATRTSLFFNNYPKLAPGAIVIVPSKP